MTACSIGVWCVLEKRVQGAAVEAEGDLDLGFVCAAVEERCAWRGHCCGGLGVGERS